jgi:hypothetical protein
LRRDYVHRCAEGIAQSPQRQLITPRTPLRHLTQVVRKVAVAPALAIIDEAPKVCGVSFHVLDRTRPHKCVLLFGSEQVLRERSKLAVPVSCDGSHRKVKVLESLPQQDDTR